MKLWFEDSNGDWRIIKDCQNSEDVYVAINDFIKRCNKNKPPRQRFKVPYLRYWDDQDGMYRHFDVGSHTEFFHLQLKEEIYG